MTGEPTQQDVRTSLTETLLGLSVALCLFLFVLSLPPFHFGLSVQTETAAAMLHLLSAIIALLCAFMVRQGNVVLLASLSSPWVVLAFVLGLWTSFSGLMSGRFLTSLSGALDQGVGALIIFESGLLIAVTHYLWRRTQWRQVLMICAMTGYVALLMLDFTGRDDRAIAPYYFGDYIAFIAFGFMGVVLSTLPGNSKWWGLAALLGALPGILLSGNKAAVGGWLLVVLVAVVMSRFRWEQRRISWYMPLALVLICSAVVYQIGGAYKPEEIDRLLFEYNYATVPAFVLSVWASLWSRAMLIKVSISGMTPDWDALLGNGWGGFNETLIRNLRVVDSRQHELVGDTLVYWDAIERNDFHSHNFLIETVLSGGFIGVAFGALLLFCMLRHWRQTGNVFGLAWLTGLVPVLCFWFQLPVTAVWLSVALGGLLYGAGVGEETAERQVRSRIVMLGSVIGLLALGLVMILVAVSAFSDSRKAGQLLQKDFSAESISLNCKTDPLTFWHETAYLSRLISVEADRLVSAENRVSQENASQRLEAFLCHADRILQDRSDIRLLTTMLNASGLIRFSGLEAVQPELIKRIVTRWTILADKLLEDEPDRIDLLIPYLNHLLLSGREDKIMDMTGYSLVLNSDEPVALWFRGVVLLGRPGDETRGLEMLKSAAKKGIADLMPIPAEMRKVIGLLP